MAFKIRNDLQQMTAIYVTEVNSTTVYSNEVISNNVTSYETNSNTTNSNTTNSNIINSVNINNTGTTSSSIMIATKLTSDEINSKTTNSTTTNSNVINSTNINNTGTTTSFNLDATKFNLIPPGTIFTFAMTKAPAGYLACDGSIKNIIDYPDLFLAIGATFNYGINTPLQFMLPDFRGKFIRGFDPTGSFDVDRRGGGFGSYQNDEFLSHSHGGVMRWPGGGPEQEQDGSPDNRSNYNQQTNAAGGSETRPKNIALLICIKY